MKHEVDRSSESNFTNSPRLLSIGLILGLVLVLASACSLPLNLGSDPGQVATNVAETVAARQTDAGGAGEKAGSETETPAAQPTDSAGPTDTAAPTDTPAPTNTATQPPTATLTPTPDQILVGVTGDTFCRTGPGSVYDQQAVLNTDQTAEILAKDPTGGFWYITNPDGQGECWIWGNYATPQGPTDQLPVYTPPPSPTPSLAFSVGFDRGDVHTGQMHVWFVIQNTGGVPLESVRTVVKSQYQDFDGTIKDQTSTSTFNGFMDGSQPVTPNLGKADPGQTVYTVSGEQTTIHGNTISVTMTICSQDNLNGSCVTRNMNFNMY
jgi:hypothetical protein